MEQGLVDASKYQISIHSLDSRFSDLKNNVNSEFRIRNPTPLKNIIRVRLASVELPLVEHAFSAAKGNDTLSAKVGGVVGRYITSERLLAGNYTAASLVNAVENLLKESINDDFTCTLNPITGFVTIKNSSLPFIIDFSSLVTDVANRPTHWGLGYYLGFRESLVKSRVVQTPTEVYHVVVGTSIINVQATPYYLLQLKCPDQVVNVTHRLNNETHIDAFAKLVLRDNYYQLQFDDGSNLLRKEYTFLSPVTIPFFQVSILDPWGKLVNMLDADWSLTLEVTEIVNSKTFADITKTYARN
jgi:hypothetical protein